VRCPASQVSRDATFWYRAASLDSDDPVLTLLLLFLACLTSFSQASQVQGPVAFEHIQGLFDEISPDDNHGPEGDEDSHEDSEEWHGFYLRDVSIRLV